MPPTPHSDDSSIAAEWLVRFLAAHPKGEPEAFEAWAADQDVLLENSALRVRLREALEEWRQAADLLGAGAETESWLSFFGRRGDRRRERPTDGDTAALHPGRRIGRFVCKSFLARGGMGQVWVAEETDLRRDVALKLVLPERLDTRTLDLFAREARAGGRLNHPNVVTTLAFGSDEGLSWIAQELVHGSWTLKDSLDDLRRLGTVPDGYYRRVAELIAKLADALQAAHDVGIIHRDVKPANVLITEGDEPKLTDFGVARIMDETAMSISGDLMGTWAYMSPEQVRAARDAIDHRTDVFSLGIVLYELLTLRRPFEGDTTQQLADRIQNTDPPSPSKLRSQCPTELSVICAKALEKSPAARYAEAADLAADLRRHLANEPILARPPGPLARAAKWARRNPVVSGVGAVGGVALVVISGFALSNAQLADANERLAEARAEEARRANEERDSVLRLSAQQDLADLLDRQDALWPPYPDKIEAYRTWIREAEALIADLPLHRARRRQLLELAHPPQTQLAESAIDEEAEWTFPESEDSARWWNAQLSQLIDGLENLRENLVSLNARTAEYSWSVGKRLAFAETLAAGLAEGGEYDRAWAAVLPQIRASHPTLAGLMPQTGLLPIGPDPDSGLWEFAHLITGVPAERSEDGELILTEETGVVLVLIPGGTYLMGAQSSNRGAPNYDPQADDDESPVHTVTLSSYFLSKYEFTQGQWLRATGSNPSAHGAHRWAPYLSRLRPEASLLHPVEQVSWYDCTTVCARIGLELPSEAQWEYACRAGTSTIFWSGDDIESLPEIANVADQWARENGGAGWGIYETLDDGHTAHARVGTYRPNPFGLHEVHGNLYEWCADEYVSDSYQRHPPVDPLIESSAPSYRVNRGGGFSALAFDARSSYRDSSTPESLDGNLGLRPARRIQR